MHINVLLTVKLIKFHGIPSRQCCTACSAAYRNIPLLPTWEWNLCKSAYIRANYYFTHNRKFPLTKLHCFLKLILRGIFFHGICLNPKLPEREGGLLKRRVHGALLLHTKTIKKCITAFLPINLLQERRKPFPQGRSFLPASAKQKPVGQRLCSSLGRNHFALLFSLLIHVMLYCTGQTIHEDSLLKGTSLI